MKMEIELNDKSIKSAIKQLKDYKMWIEQKEKELVERLASIGVVEIHLGYNRALKGIEKIDVTSEWTSPNTMIIRASGKEVAFVEFGAGLIGYGHPQADEFGVGPGTYPEGKGHWDNPNGWWYQDATGKHHSKGNEASMVMYNTARKLEQEVERVVKEVFR